MFFERYKKFISTLIDRAIEDPEFLGILLVGSHARGERREDSDLDLVILLKNPAPYFSSKTWLKNFGPVKSTLMEDYGALGSLRVFYESVLEIEFGLTGIEWARPDPIDPGTLKVVQDGVKILYDPHGHFASLISEANKI